MRLIAPAACAIASVGCSSGSPAGAPPGPRPDGGETSLHVPRISEGSVPMAEQGDAADAVAIVDGYFPLSDGERTCLGARIVKDPALGQRVPRGLSPGSADFHTVAGFVQRCKQVTAGELFADNLPTSRSVTDDQKHCLAVAYGELSPDDGVCQMNGVTGLV